MSIHNMFSWRNKKNIFRIPLLSEAVHQPGINLYAVFHDFEQRRFVQPLFHLHHKKGREYFSGLTSLYQVILGLSKTSVYLLVMVALTLITMRLGKIFSRHFETVSI